MPIPALALAGISLGSKLLGAFGKKKKEQAAEKLQKEQAANLLAAQKKGFSQGEKGRIAALKSLVNTAGARGIKGIDMTTLDPSLFQEREFIAPEVAKSSGKSGFGSFLEGLGSVGGSVADFLTSKQEEEEEKSKIKQLLACIGNPGAPGCPGARGGAPRSAGQPIGGGFRGPAAPASPGGEGPTDETLDQFGGMFR